jgi:hypothetical protein
MAQGMTTNLSIGLRQGFLDYTSDLHKKRFLRLRPRPAGAWGRLRSLLPRAQPLGALAAWLPAGKVDRGATHLIVLHALPCLALPCLALPCLALPCLVDVPGFPRAEIAPLICRLPAGLLLLAYGLASGGVLAWRSWGRRTDVGGVEDVAEQLGRLVGQAAGGVRSALREVAPGWASAGCGGQGLWPLSALPTTQQGRSALPGGAAASVRRMGDPSELLAAPVTSLPAAAGCCLRRRRRRRRRRRASCRGRRAAAGALLQERCWGLRWLCRGRWGPRWSEEWWSRCGGWPWGGLRERLEHSSGSSVIISE